MCEDSGVSRWTERHSSHSSRPDLYVYTRSPGPAGTTKVQYTFETEPALLSDRLLEAIGGRAWNLRQAAKALRRLRTILEEDRGRGRRASVAGR